MNQNQNSDQKPGQQQQGGNQPGQQQQGGGQKPGQQQQGGGQKPRPERPAGPEELTLRHHGERKPRPSGGAFRLFDALALCAASHML